MLGRLPQSTRNYHLRGLATVGFDCRADVEANSFQALAGACSCNPGIFFYMY